jgi:hypothetical protein
MRDSVGVVRSGAGLARAIAELDRLAVDRGELEAGVLEVPAGAAPSGVVEVAEVGCP